MVPPRQAWNSSPAISPPSWGREKIRVNALVPGPFPQPGKMPPGLEPRLAERTMLGRIGAAEEIGGPLLFLAAPASAFVTGTCLNVDGGWTAW